jgi:outer membrane biosynthesis protein TonB
MTAVAARWRESMAPSALAALALHLAVFLALVLLGRSALAPMGTAVPITIVSKAPTTDSRAAEADRQTQTAQVETPVPEAKTPPPPPAPPQPAPKAEVPAPTPKPVPKPVLKAKAQPTKSPPAKSSFNLDALQASLTKYSHPSPPKPSFARQGAARPETAPIARVDAGSGVSQSDISGLSQLLQRLWNPNCDAEGGDTVVVPAKFSVGDDGRVVGRVTEGGRETSPDPAVFAAARRAKDAIHQAEPYAEVYRGKSFTVIFDAKKACGQP